MAQNTFGQDITKIGGSVVPTTPIAPITPSSSISANELNLDKNNAGIYSAIKNLPQPTPTAPVTAPSIQSIVNSAYATTPSQQKQETLSTDIGNLGSKLAGETAYRTNLEQQYNVPQLTKTLNDLTTQFNTLTDQEQAAPLQIEQAYEHRGATTGGVAPIQSAASRDIAIKKMGVAAALTAAQGNVATANSLIDSAVKAQFDPIQAQLDAKKAQLTALQPYLTADEKKQSEILQAQSQDRQNEIDQQKTDRQTILSVMTTAAQNGADSLTLQKIQQAQTPGEAIQEAGSFYAKPNIMTSTDNAGNVYGIDQNTGKVVWTANGVGKAASSASSISGTSDADLIAQAIINGDQPPSLTGLYGKGASVRAALEANGYNLTAATEDWNAMQKWTSTQNSATVIKAQTAAETAQQEVTNLQGLLQQWHSSNFPILNAAEVKTAMNGALGPDAQNLATQINDQIIELNQDMGSVYRYGNSPTDSSMQSASETLKQNWSNAQIMSALDVLNKNVAYRINALRSTQNIVSGTGAPNQYVGAASSTTPSFQTDNNGRITSGSTSSGLSFTISY